MSNVKTWVSAAFLIAGAAISIGVSAYQFQNSSGDFNNTDDFNFKDECNDYPFKYMRPFSLSVDNVDSNPYCGYGENNTAFRLAVGCVTFIVGCLMPFNVLNSLPKVIYWTLFSLAVLWYSVTVADCTALVNSTGACEDSYGDISGIECESSVYGVTIAIDFVLSLAVMSIWILNMTGPEGPGLANAEVTNPTANKI